MAYCSLACSGLLDRPERYRAPLYFYIKTLTGDFLTTSSADNTPVLSHPRDLSCRWLRPGKIFHFSDGYLVSDTGDHLQFQFPPDCGPGFEQFEGETYGVGDIGE